jgi:hypothetical protein
MAGKSHTREVFFYLIHYAIVWLRSTLLVVALTWLAEGHLKLEREYNILVNTVHGNIHDIAGLCAAALSVDSPILTK